MTDRDHFILIFAPEVVEHLAVIEARHHSFIRKTIKEQLSSTPEVATRNRKLLEQPAPFDARWELRFGPDNRFRVFYQVDTQRRSVWILAIGVKERNRLWIGREEFES
jgi:mRNA-degrading endonuclease RelE of RelBE toxin-antitoxin system